MSILRLSPRVRSPSFEYWLLHRRENAIFQAHHGETNSSDSVEILPFRRFEIMPGSRIIHADFGIHQVDWHCLGLSSKNPWWRSPMSRQLLASRIRRKLYRRVTGCRSPSGEPRASAKSFSLIGLVLNNYRDRCRLSSSNSCDLWGKSIAS